MINVGFDDCVTPPVSSPWIETFHPPAGLPVNEAVATTRVDVGVFRMVTVVSLRTVLRIVVVDSTVVVASVSWVSLRTVLRVVVLDSTVVVPFVFWVSL